MPTESTPHTFHLFRFFDGSVTCVAPLGSCLGLRRLRLLGHVVTGVSSLSGCVLEVAEMQVSAADVSWLRVQFPRLVLVGDALAVSSLPPSP